MQNIISFLNQKKYMWIIFIIVQQIFIVLYFQTNISSIESKIADKFIIIFDLSILVYIYMAGHIRKNEDNFLSRIIIIVSLIIWQHFWVLNINEYWFDFGVAVQPLITYFFIVESFNLLLYEEIDFKIKIDRILKFTVIVISFLFWIDRTYFNLAYLILFAILHVYPLAIMIYYRKYFNCILLKIKRSCMIFSIFILCMLIFYLLKMLFVINTVYSNIGWYMTTILICVIIYLRLVQSAVLIRVKNILSRIIFLILLLILLWIIIIYKVIHDIDLFILVISVTELFVFVIVLFIRIYLEYEKNVIYRSSENMKIINILKIEEQSKEKFAEYLHDDILQNIIALKNIIQVSTKSNKAILVSELNHLILNIRNEIDNQKPIISEKRNLKKVYQELISELIMKYQTNKIIDFHCDDIIIYSPYSSIIYRIIKELINNGIKHASGNIIQIYLSIESDNVYLKTVNLTENKEIKLNSGLTNVMKKVKQLTGSIDYYIDQGYFYVDIIIPMERSVCFENIID